MRARQPALHAGSIGAPDAWCPARAPLHRCAGRGRGQGEKERGTNAVPAPCAAWRLAASGRRAAGWLATASGEKAAAERGNTMSADPSISTRSASIALSGLQLAGSAAAAVYALENFSTVARRIQDFAFHFCFCAKQNGSERGFFPPILMAATAGIKDGDDVCKLFIFDTRLGQREDNEHEKVCGQPARRRRRACVLTGAFLRSCSITRRRQRSTSSWATSGCARVSSTSPARSARTSRAAPYTPTLCARCSGNRSQAYGWCWW